ncbi:unnamed protein product [Coffea canephora]|uniref:Uncharacterized protein n=1 Tax=Coffea canephora TaxID=49390 RepID=A0A068V7T7_COFCA|nr:unnamed protein product [Coffea canephora]
MGFFIFFLSSCIYIYLSKCFISNFCFQIHTKFSWVEASTNQVADQAMPVYNLPWKILCRVINVQLKAEPDTDEVFALVTLMPEPDVSLHMEPLPPPPLRFHLHSFCKTFPASDTSTHG